MNTSRTPDGVEAAPAAPAPTEVRSRAPAGSATAVPAQEAFVLQCEAIREGMIVILRDRPCKVVKIARSKTGKHGSQKGFVVGIDVFTGQKLEVVCNAKEELQGPNVSFATYTVRAHCAALLARCSIRAT